jgi:hypothetical protein
LLWCVVHWRRHEHRLSIVIIGLLISRLVPSIIVLLITTPFSVLMPFAPVTPPMAFATLSER